MSLVPQGQMSVKVAMLSALPPSKQCSVFALQVSNQSDHSAGPGIQLVSSRSHLLSLNMASTVSSVDCVDLQMLFPEVMDRRCFLVVVTQGVNGNADRGAVV